jgi:predicted acylesterase/phospholipase RssA
MSMKKKLKVALVIGGGVSLGAFNGGAIAEM